MKAFPKLREKLFPRSIVGISAFFGKEKEVSEPVSLPALEDSLPAIKEYDSQPERLELTPELEEALFPKTPLMISATFELAKAGETPSEASKVARSSRFEDKQDEGEQDFPIV